jgi:hypothetical protein
MSCEPRWADQTRVYAAAAADGAPEPCTFALLFRFMNSQGALYRAVENPIETVMCGARALGKQIPVCRDALRLNISPDALVMLPRKVDLAWHSHGLWGSR